MFGCVDPPRPPHEDPTQYPQEETGVEYLLPPPPRDEGLTLDPDARVRLKLQAIDPEGPSPEEHHVPAGIRK